MYGIYPFVTDTYKVFLYKNVHGFVHVSNVFVFIVVQHTHVPGNLPASDQTYGKSHWPYDIAASQLVIYLRWKVSFLVVLVANYPYQSDSLFT